MKKIFIILSILGLSLILGYACSKKSSSNPLATTTTHQVQYLVSATNTSTGSFLHGLVATNNGYAGDSISYQDSSQSTTLKMAKPLLYIPPLVTSPSLPWTSPVITVNAGWSASLTVTLAKFTNTYYPGLIQSYKSTYTNTTYNLYITEDGVVKQSYSFQRTLTPAPINITFTVQ